MNIIGAGGHAKVVLDILIESGIEIEGIWDDNSTINSLLGYDISGSLDDFLDKNRTNVVLAIGDNRARKKLAQRIASFDGTVIHPNSQISRFSSIGQGSVVMGNVTLNASAQVGEHCILNTSCSVDHDCVLEDYVHISPNVALAGNVSVGEGTHIGIGSSVIQNIKIGKWATIGAGAVIINDVPDYAVVVGNPGRVIKYNYPDER